jgi:hypothetical protein
LAHTIRKFLGQDLGPGIGAAPLGRDFEQVRSKGNGSGPHSELIRWDEKAGLRRDAIRSQGLTRSRRNAKETGL